MVQLSRVAPYIFACSRRDTSTRADNTQREGKWTRSFRCCLLSMHRTPLASNAVGWSDVQPAKFSYHCSSCNVLYSVCRLHIRSEAERGVARVPGTSSLTKASLQELSFCSVMELLYRPYSTSCRSGFKLQECLSRRVRYHEPTNNGAQNCRGTSSGRYNNEEN